MQAEYLQYPLGVASHPVLMSLMAIPFPVATEWLRALIVFRDMMQVRMYGTTWTITARIWNKSKYQMIYSGLYFRIHILWGCTISLKKKKKLIVIWSIFGQFWQILWLTYDSGLMGIINLFGCDTSMDQGRMFQSWPVNLKPGPVADF